MPPVYDQGAIGSCTANAIAAAYDYAHNRQGLGFITPSRLFIYANERLLENTPLTEDSGAQIFDGVHCVANQGVCPESEWPYDNSQFSVTPPQTCYQDALRDLVVAYEKVDPQYVLAALAHSRPDVGYQQGMNELAGLALLARWQPALGPQPRDPNAAAAAQLWLSVQLQRLRPQAAAI